MTKDPKQPTNQFYPFQVLKEDEGDPTSATARSSEVTQTQEDVARTDHEDEEIVQSPIHTDVTDQGEDLANEFTSTSEIATTVVSPTHEVTSLGTVWLVKTPETTTTSHVVPRREDVLTQDATPTPKVATTEHNGDPSHDITLTTLISKDVPTNKNSTSCVVDNDGKAIEDSLGSSPSSGITVEATDSMVDQLKEDADSEEEEIDNEDSSNLTHDEAPSPITAAKFKPSRRASYAKKCQYEKFSTAPYITANMAGFITNRPRKWVAAFISYANEGKKTCRYKQEKDNTGACKEFNILLISEESKQVSICIKLVTGYVSIKGAGFQAWIDSDFPIVTKHVNTEENDIAEEKPEETRGDGEKEEEESKAKLEKGKDKDKENNDVAQLWEENRVLRNALKTLERAIESVQTKECVCKDTDEESIRRMFDKKVAELEKKYDDKLMTFRNTLEHDQRTGIKEAKKVINNKVGNLHDDFIKHKQATEDECNGIFYKITDLTSRFNIQSQAANKPRDVNSELKESIAEIEARMKEITDSIQIFKTEDPRNGIASNMENIGVKLNSIASNMDTLTSAYNGLTKQLTCQQPNPSTRVDRLTPSAPAPSNTVNYPPPTQNYYSHNPFTFTHPSAPKQPMQTVPLQQTVPIPSMYTRYNEDVVTNAIPQQQQYYTTHPSAPKEPPMETIPPQQPSPIPLMYSRCDKAVVMNALSNQLQQDDNNMDTNDSKIHGNENVDDNTELLILIDSNSNHVDRRRFWALDKTKWRRCGTISEAVTAIHETHYSKLQYVLVSVGTNDTDDEGSGIPVARQLLDLVEMIKQKHPGTKIILNEVTPRKGPRDKEVIDCNKALIDVVANDERVFLAKQSNLRDSAYTFFFDEKHVKSSKIGRYVNNLKIALRKAYGYTDYRQSNMNNGEQTRGGNYFQRESSHYSLQPPYNENNVRRMDIPSKQQIRDFQMKKNLDTELKYEIRRTLLSLFD